MIADCNTFLLKFTITKSTFKSLSIKSQYNKYIFKWFKCFSPGLPSIIWLNHTLFVRASELYGELTRVDSWDVYGSCKPSLCDSSIYSGKFDRWQDIVVEAVGLADLTNSCLSCWVTCWSTLEVLEVLRGYEMNRR